MWHVILASPRSTHRTSIWSGGRLAPTSRTASVSGLTNIAVRAEPAGSGVLPDSVSNDASTALCGTTKWAIEPSLIRTWYVTLISLTPSGAGAFVTVTVQTPTAPGVRTFWLA